jgi:hypothetical protein
VRPGYLGVEFLAGAVTLAYLIAGLYFLRFWWRTRDGLFRSFAAAFGLFAANQTVVSFLGPADELTGYAYVLRIIGFLLILGAIVWKNLGRRQQGAPGRE